MDDDDIDARGSSGISFSTLAEPASCADTDARGMIVLWVAVIARSSTSSERRVSREDADEISFSRAMDVAALDARFGRACKEGEFAWNERVGERLRRDSECMWMLVRFGGEEGARCTDFGGSDGAAAMPRINARRVSVNGSVILSKSMVS